MQKVIEDHLYPHAKVGVLIAVIVITLSYGTIYFWMRDGIDTIEIAMMSLIVAIYAFALTIILNVWGINQYRKWSLENHIIPIKSFLSILLILVIVMMLLLLVDYLIFHFIDNSISSNYATSLEELLNSSGQSTDGIEEFYEMPFIFQNGITIFTALVFACLLSWPFIKSNGRLFKSINEAAL